jgi:hypothetical protein
VPGATAEPATTPEREASDSSEPRPTRERQPRDPKVDAESLVVLISQLDMQQGWIDEELIRKRAQGLGFEARTVFYDDASDLESMLKLDRDADLRRVGLALVDAGEMRRLAEKNRLRPIGDLAESGDVETELREHLPLARDGARVTSLGDDVYGLPRSVDTPLMVYRRSKVQEAVQV